MVWYRVGPCEGGIDIDKAFGLTSYIEHTKLIDIVDKAEIYYEPNDSNTNISEDDNMMNDYIEFSKIINECYNEGETDQSEAANNDNNIEPAKTCKFEKK